MNTRPPYLASAPLTAAGWLLYDLAPPGLFDDDGRPVPPEQWRHESTGEPFTPDEVATLGTATLDELDAAHEQHRTAVAIARAELAESNALLARVGPVIRWARSYEGLDLTVGDALGVLSSMVAKFRADLPTVTVEQAEAVALGWFDRKAREVGA